ncbi:hypothetical protein ACA910_014778 [Epithemia clementina (nom. ined.)]
MSIREAVSGISNNKGYAILVQALSNTQTFVWNLVAFIDKTMEDLVGNSDFDERKAWSITTQIMSQIFSNIHEVCRTISTLLQPNNPDSVCAYVLWGVLWTQDVMQEYIDTQFQGHPSISSEYIKFLAVNSGTKTVKKLEGKFEKLQEKNAVLMEQIKKTSSKADSASNIVDS